MRPAPCNVRALSPLDCAGKDATAAFRDVGHSDEALRLRETFRIGRIGDRDQSPVEETR